MKKSLIMAAIAATVLGASLTASAKFVLFGSETKDAAPAAEQKFVAPLTTPYYNEDSFVTSDLRAWFVYHDFPTGGSINGGSAKVYALQARLALTDQLQLVAYKDGYVDFDSGLTDDSGWNDIAAGLKWNFLQDKDNQLYAAVGAGYELPLGDPSVLQNDDEIRVWASVNKGFDKLHLGGTLNVLFPVGGEDVLGDSTRLIWNLHADYYVCKWFSPVLEFTGIHKIDEGDVVLPVSGVDVANLGGGSDVITGALGAEFRIDENLAVRAAYEIPIVSTDDDLWGNRFTFSVVYGF